MKGHFHFAEKKGYSGVGLYSRRRPSAVRLGFGDAEFDAEGRYVEARFDRPSRRKLPRLSIVSCYFPSGSSGEHRQAAKFRFLALMAPYLRAARPGARVHPGRRHQHRPQGDRPEELEGQPQEQRLPARGARLDDAPVRGARLRRRVPHAQPASRAVHLVEQPRPGVRQERRLAPRLPPGDARRRRARAAASTSTSSSASPTTRRSSSTTTSPSEPSHCAHHCTRATPTDHDLDAIEIETAPNPTRQHDHPARPRRRRQRLRAGRARARSRPVGPVRFVFPHAPVRPVTINNGYVMRGLVRHLQPRRAEPARGRRRPAPVAGAGRGPDRPGEGARHPGAADRPRRLQPGLRDDADDRPAPRRAPRRPGGMSGYLPLAAQAEAERHASQPRRCRSSWRTARSTR